MIQKERIITIGSWIIIVFFSMLAILTIIIAWWYYFFEIPTSMPSDIIISYSRTVSPQQYIYNINWKNNDPWKNCSYDYSILDTSSNEILFSGTTTNTEIETPPVINGIYVFILTARAKTWFSSKKESGEISTQFTVNNPNSGYSEKEVFLVAGQDSSDNWQTFTDSDSASGVCQAINGSILATDIQLTSAFNDGADWWLYGWYNDSSSGNSQLAYPCWFSSRGCKEGKAGIVEGGDSGLGHVTCYGIKPPQNQSLNIPSNLIKNSNVTTISRTTIIKKIYQLKMHVRAI